MKTITDLATLNVPEEQRQCPLCGHCGMIGMVNHNDTWNLRCWHCEEIIQPITDGNFSYLVMCGLKYQPLPGQTDNQMVKNMVSTFFNQSDISI